MNEHTNGRTERRKLYTPRHTCWEYKYVKHESVNQICPCTINSNCTFEGLSTYSGTNQAWHVCLISWLLNTGVTNDRLVNVQHDFLIWCKTELKTRAFNLLLEAWLTGQQIGDQCWFKFRIVRVLIHIYVAVKSDDTIKHVKNSISKCKQEHRKQNLYEKTWIVLTDAE